MIAYAYVVFMMHLVNFIQESPTGCRNAAIFEHTVRSYAVFLNILDSNTACLTTQI
jgi:hypothetical protein